jgi:hypothetical protein
MGMNINEPGRNYEPARIDGRRGFICNSANDRNPALIDGDIRKKCGVSGTIDDPAIANDQVMGLKTETK